MMSNHPDKRIDSGSRLIKAAPEKIYQAHLDPAAIAAWRPPEGMECKIYAFDPREGGVYKMAFIYKDSGHDVRGKTSEHEDVFQGRFVELAPGRRIVEAVEFESDDPAFAGTMRVVTTLTPAPEGTLVNIACEDVPPGIRPEDHHEGIQSTLRNLAAYTE